MYHHVDEDDARSGNWSSVLQFSTKQNSVPGGEISPEIHQHSLCSFSDFNVDNSPKYKYDVDSATADYEVMLTVQRLTEKCATAKQADKQSKQLTANTQEHWRTDQQPIVMRSGNWKATD